LITNCGEVPEAGTAWNIMEVTLLEILEHKNCDNCVCCLGMFGVRKMGAKNGLNMTDARSDSSGKNLKKLSRFAAEQSNAAGGLLQDQNLPVGSC